MFFGYKILVMGILLDMDKVKLIYNFFEFLNVSEFRSFFGFIFYYWKFVKDFVSKVVFLYKFLRKGVEFIWDSNCESVFKIFKEVLISYFILRYFDFLFLFVLYIDVCDIGIGVVLV